MAALVIIWLGYPVVVWLVARLGGLPTTVRAPSAPRVSVIVASRDSPEAIRERVRDAFAAVSPEASLEVIVARDVAGPDSAPFDIAAEEAGGGGAGGWKSVRVIRGDEPGGKACALNAAVRTASGDILVFTDTAQRFAPNAIPLLVRALANERLGAVSGALQLASDTGTHRRSLTEWYWRFERWLRENEARVHSAIGVTGAIYAMRRTNWRALPPGVLCDDLYVPMELVLRGYRIGFLREARAIDVRRFETAQEYQRKVRTLTGVLQLCFWLPAVLLPIRNPVWLQFVCHKILRLLTPYLVIVALVGGAAGLTRPAGGLSGSALLMLSLGTALVLSILSRRVRSTLAMGLAMQRAVLRATFNGLRGNWDVW